MEKPPPLSSKSRAKGGGSESPPDDTPMDRFRATARVVINAPRAKVLAAEKRLAAASKARKKR
jgi:hypothetical protein